MLHRERTERNGLQTLPLSFCRYKEPLHLPEPVFSHLFCCCVFTLGSDSYRSSYWPLFAPDLDAEGQVERKCGVHTGLLGHEP